MFNSMQPLPSSFHPASWSSSDAQLLGLFVAWCVISPGLTHTLLRSRLAQSTVIKPEGAAGIHTFLPGDVGAFRDIWKGVTGGKEGEVGESNPSLASRHSALTQLLP